MLRSFVESLRTLPELSPRSSSVEKPACDSALPLPSKSSISNDQAQTVQRPLSRAENLDPSLRGRPVQARLEGMAMTLSPLD
jgi:hypothetical protein